MTEQTQENPPVLPAIRRLLKLSGKNQAWLYLANLAMVKNLTASALLGVVQQSVMAVAASIALFIINWHSHPY